MAYTGLHLRALSLVRPYWRNMILAVALMVLCAVVGVFSVGMVLPFLSMIFSGGRISLAESPSAANAVGHTPKSLATAQDAVIQTILGPFQSDSAMTTLSRICICILAVYLLKGVLTYLLAITCASIEQRVIRDVRNRLYTHLHNLSLSFFHQSRTGGLISRITNDVALLRMTISAGFLEFMRDLTVVLFYAAVVLVISWKLALVAFVIIPPITYSVSRIGRRLRRYTTKAQEKMADITGVLQETISGIRVVKAFGMERFETAKFYRHTGDFYRFFLKQQRAASLAPPMTEFLGACGLLVVLWYGCKQVLVGNLLSPALFLTFLFFMASMLHPAKNLTYANARIQEGLAAAQRIFAVLDTLPEIADAPEAIEIQGINEGIEFKQVSFGYGDADYVLRDINFKVKKGQVLALVGPSGAGKSTLVDLIPRFYDPTDGAVAIDGVDLRRISTRSLRGLMGIVTQEVILFNDTVRNNIAYGAEEMSFDRVVEAARAANAHQFIENLPHGYDTLIGDRGVRLSGGERQRIAIARAILKDPQILIFDEATSSLDSEAERLVQDAIQRLMSNRTAFVIAHRLSTVTSADMILVIEDGRIVEAGRHEELVAAGKVYRRLYDLQFRDVPQILQEG